MSRWFAVLAMLILLIPMHNVHAQDATLGAVASPQLNVRAGPGVAYPVIGTLNRNARITFSGRNDDASWLYFTFWSDPGWVSASYIRVLQGSIDALPVVTVEAVAVVEAVAPPSEPQAPATEIALVSYSLTPLVPAPGQPFSIMLTLRGPGRPLGPFVVAGLCASEFVSAQVGHLDADATAQVEIQCTAPSATGSYPLDLVFDVDRRQASGSARGSIFINRAFATQSAVRFPAYANLDLFGGTPDLAWDGVEITAINGASLRALPGMGLTDAHYDALQDIESHVIPRSQMTPGAIFAVRCAEGSLALLRFERWSDDAPVFAFWVYA